MTEVEAAIRVRISPDLLRWFTKYAPKHGASRKLPFTEDKGEYFYDEDELVSFDRYLKEPWPIPPASSRPGVPTGVEREILIEANNKCSFCEYVQSGEAAHIDAVHLSRCNHPHNLIWACPNHHTQYDNGYKVATVINPTHVKVIKEILLEARMRHWRIELRAASEFLTVIEILRKISGYLNKPEFQDLRTALAALAKQLIEHTAKSAEGQKQAKVTPGTPAAYQRYASKVAKLVPTEGALTAKDVTRAADRINDATEEYFQDAQLRECPLCHGGGEHNRYRCPICGGDGTIAKDADVDLRPYQQVECRLCKGTGSHNRFDCPVCSGVGTVDSEISDTIDLRPYEQIECPLCEGSGTHNRSDCPICSGIGTIDEAALERLDLSPYEQIKCPLCKGAGDRNGRQCDLCHGVGSVDEGLLETVDLTPYEQVQCPVCRGKGVRKSGGECSLCEGRGSVDEGILEGLDLAPYELVKCPCCKGRGELKGMECGFCRGNCEVEAGRAENFDPRD